jgi:small-conductance mechanosensitive channel
MNISAATNSFDETVASAMTTFSGWLENFFGPAVHNTVVGPITWADLAAALAIILVTLIVNGIVALILRRQMKKTNDDKHWHFRLFSGMRGPVFLFIWLAGLYLAVWPLLLKFFSGDALARIETIRNKTFSIAVFIAIFWLFIRFTRVLEARLTLWASKTENKFDDLLVPLIGKGLRVIVPVVGIIFALPVLGLSPSLLAVLGRGSSILLIVAIGVVLFQAVSVGEKVVLAEYDIHAADNLQARKIYTQVHVISKTLYVIISIFVLASILMLFQEVRQFGTSILASAGVLGIIIGFAAQKTIANLFAGFQLAMAQPIRLDDVVIVEGEWGNIEEITLTYVVIKIWDERRLVVPLSYFIEKPFQNWTRATAQLLGSVFFWVDYTLPLEEARAALKEIIETHPLWDKRFWNLQVTDATEKTMQIRVLATSADSSKSWDLRCAIREQFLVFVQKNYPQSLPRVRAEINSNEHKSELQKLPL